MAVRKPALTEDEVAALSRQMSFRDVFEDLLDLTQASAELEAQAMRDKQMLLYKLRHEHNTLGAKCTKQTENGEIYEQINLTYGNYAITAEETRSSDRVSHTDVYENVTKSITYHKQMLETCVDRLTHLSKDDPMYETIRTESIVQAAKLAAFEQVLQFKKNATTAGAKGDFTLRIKMAPKR